MSSAPLLIEAHDLTIAADSGVVLEQLEVNLPRGGRYAVLGADGTGKSQLLYHLMGLRAPQGGRVSMDLRQPAHTIESVPRFGAWLGPHGLLTGMTVAQNLDLMLRKWTTLDSVSMAAVIQSQLEDFELGADANTLIDDLDTFGKRRAGMARALIFGPDLVFLDEPARGLEPVDVERLAAILHRLSEANGLALFLTSAQVDPVVRMTQHCIVLDRELRRATAQGAPQQLEELDDPTWLAGLGLA